jgi:hypothetical protein
MSLNLCLSSDEFVLDMDSHKHVQSGGRYQLVGAQGSCSMARSRQFRHRAGQGTVVSRAHTRTHLLTHTHTCTCTCTCTHRRAQAYARTHNRMHRFVTQNWPQQQDCGQTHSPLQAALNYRSASRSRHFVASTTGIRQHTCSSATFFGSSPTPCRSSKH